MGVLLKELAAQGLAIGVIRRHPNRVDRGVTTIALNPANGIGIDLEDGGLVGPLPADPAPPAIAQSRCPGG